MGLIKDAILIGVGAYLGYRYGRGRQIEGAVQDAVQSVQTQAQEVVGQIEDLLSDEGGAVTDLDPESEGVQSAMGRRYRNCGGCGTRRWR